MILELHEEGSHEAAEYFKFLFDLDEETRKTAGPDTVIWNKPRLRDNKELIDQLREVLTIFRQRTSRNLFFRKLVRVFERGEQNYEHLFILCYIIELLI